MDWFLFKKHPDNRLRGRFYIANISRLSLLRRLSFYLVVRLSELFCCSRFASFIWRHPGSSEWSVRFCVLQVHIVQWSCRKQKHQGKYQTIFKQVLNTGECTLVAKTFTQTTQKIEKKSHTNWSDEICMAMNHVAVLLTDIVRVVFYMY